MFGTGEWASSASESTSPSCTSSSWRSGTYCRQIGSPGDLIRSTMAGAMRNSKFRAACRRRSRSGKCSARSEERRVGKECRSRGSRDHEKKKKNNDRAHKVRYNEGKENDA